MQGSSGQPIIIKRSKQQIRIGLVWFAFVLFFLCGLTLYQGMSWFKCFLMLPFISGMFLGLHSLKDDQPMLVMDNEMIHIRGRSAIRWDSIRDTWIETYRAIDVMVLELETRERVRCQLSGFDMRGGDIRKYIENQVALSKS